MLKQNKREGKMLTKLVSIVLLSYGSVLIQVMNYPLHLLVLLTTMLLFSSVIVEYLDLPTTIGNNYNWRNVNDGRYNFCLIELKEYYVSQSKNSYVGD